jgi:poly(3-hydroxybutyrate) depolymerase
MDGSMMLWFSGLSKKSDESGFLVAHPSGSGFQMKPITFVLSDQRSIPS